MSAGRRLISTSFPAGRVMCATAVSLGPHRCVATSYAELQTENGRQQWHSWPNCWSCRQAAGGVQMYAPVNRSTGERLPWCHRPNANNWYPEEQGTPCGRPQTGWCIRCHAPLCGEHMGQCIEDERCMITVHGVEEWRREALERVAMLAASQVRAKTALAAAVVAALAYAMAHGPPGKVQRIDGNADGEGPENCVPRGREKTGPYAGLGPAGCPNPYASPHPDGVVRAQVLPRWERIPRP